MCPLGELSMYRLGVYFAFLNHYSLRCRACSWTGRLSPDTENGVQILSFFSTTCYKQYYLFRLQSFFYRLLRYPRSTFSCRFVVQCHLNNVKYSKVHMPLFTRRIVCNFKQHTAQVISYYRIYSTILVQKQIFRQK